MIYPNGDVYQGKFAEGCYTCGSYMSVDGKKYAGYWRNQLRDGLGCEIW